MPQKRRFALLLSETYKTTVGSDAKKVNRKSKDGKKNNGVSVYHWTEFPILQLCLNKMLFEDNVALVFRTMGMVDYYLSPYLLLQQLLQA
jgi:hypothetical protein